MNMKSIQAFAKPTLIALATLILGHYPARAAIAMRGTGATAAWSSGSTITLTKPTGVVAGDVMLVSIAQHDSSGTPTAATLSGWTPVKSGTLGGNSPDFGTILYKVAGSSEPSNYAFSLVGTVSGGVGGIVAYSGVDNTTPLDVAVASTFTSSAGRSTSLGAGAVTAITAVTNNALAILFGMAADYTSTNSSCS